MDKFCESISLDLIKLLIRVVLYPLRTLLSYTLQLKISIFYKRLQPSKIAWLTINLRILRLTKATSNCLLI